MKLCGRIFSSKSLVQHPVAGIIAQCTTQSTSSSAMMDLGNTLVTTTQSISMDDKISIIHSFTSRGLRHEPLLEKCFWDVFKYELTPQPPQEPLEKQVSRVTYCFRVMCEQKLHTDPNLLALSLGKCLELSDGFGLSDTINVYEGLRHLDSYHFSLTDVWRARESGREGTFDSTSRGAVVFQPNLLDLLVSDVESRFGVLIAEQDPHSPHFSDAIQMALGAMLVTGVHSDSVLGSVLGALRRQPQHPGVEYYCACLLHISKLWYRERNMVTPERGSGFGKTQADLVEFVSGRIANALRSDARLSPDMILQLRALCESSPIVQLHGAELWNSIRCQRVSRRYASPKSRDSGFNMGTLSKPQYYVTPKKISIDLSNAEQKVPPVFKTWQSPVHKRRRQRGAGRAPQRVKFGTQRISSNYLKKKRNKVIAT